MYTKGFLHTLTTILHSSLGQQFSIKDALMRVHPRSFFSFKKYIVFSNKSLFKY